MFNKGVTGGYRGDQAVGRGDNSGGYRGDQTGGYKRGESALGRGDDGM
ncbi:hypothetical protein KJ616_00805 [Patescibacteria group bacterium]|nr:hypothetical protein [Patescibacteria group bacterium]